jgi:predicted 2-oxoglutarate/Fe(II)-dependent dioxygenase YbiX
MSKRLQVLLGEDELDEIRKMARRQRTTVAQWVREAIREARRRSPAKDRAAKLRAIQRASEHDFPTGDIGQMLAEIERGYSQES